MIFWSSGNKTTPIVAEWALMQIMDIIKNPIISENDIIAVTWAFTFTVLIFSICTSLLWESARGLFFSGSTCLKIMLTMNGACIHSEKFYLLICNILWIKGYLFMDWKILKYKNASNTFMFTTKVTKFCTKQKNSVVMKMKIDWLDGLPLSLNPQNNFLVEGSERAPFKSCPSHREIEDLIKSLRDAFPLDIPLLIIPRAVHIIGYAMMIEITNHLVFLFQELSPFQCTITIYLHKEIDSEWR